MIFNRVRELRETMGFSQRQFARKLRVTQATLSRLESGKVGRLDLDVLDRLCRIIDCQPGQLLFHRRNKTRRG